MRVLFLCSELEGYIKTGGLADATRALAFALHAKGHDVRVLLPRYAPLYALEVLPEAQSVFVPLGEETLGCAVREVAASELPVFLLEHHDFFNRERPYDDGDSGYLDNSRRFSFFCKAALQWCTDQTWKPEIIHAHDWQTGAAAYYLHQYFKPVLPKTRVVFTVHNGAYQQHLSSSELWQNDLHWPLEGVGSYATPSLLAFGVLFADKVATVSPGYANELLFEPAANGLSAVYKHRGSDFCGILNGVDNAIWNPETDVHLPANYSMHDVSGKTLCKDSLIKRFDFKETSWPLFVAVSRLTRQKGYDYLIPALEQFLLNAKALVIVMGTGEALYVQALERLSEQHPLKFRFVHGFDEALSHQLEAGGDFFLMPSLFEPCGLNQMYSLRYGTVPLVRATGGLKDTVRCLESHAPTGICFDEPEQSALLAALAQALTLFEEKERYQRVQKWGMAQKFDWRLAAKAYLKLYQEAFVTE